MPYFYLVKHFKIFIQVVFVLILLVAFSNNVNKLAGKALLPSVEQIVTDIDATLLFEDVEFDDVITPTKQNLIINWCNKYLIASFPTTLLTVYALVVIRAPPTN